MAATAACLALSCPSIFADIYRDKRSENLYIERNIFLVYTSLNINLYLVLFN